MTEKHAPMKPFWALINDKTGTIVSYYHDEPSSTWQHSVDDGTHRIAQCVEVGAQGERRVVSYVQNEAGEIWAFCSDGQIFELSADEKTWLELTKLPPIPQPEPAPASGDLERELRALASEIDSKSATQERLTASAIRVKIDAILAKGGNREMNTMRKELEEARADRDTAIAQASEFENVSRIITVVNAQYNERHNEISAELSAALAEVKKRDEVIARFRYAKSWIGADSLDWCSDCKDRMTHAEEFARLELGLDALTVNETAEIGARVITHLAALNPEKGGE